MLAEGLAIAVEKVAAAVTRLLVIRTVLAASFAVSLAIVVMMMLVRLNSLGRSRGTEYRQRQRAEEIASLAGPVHHGPTHAPFLRCHWSNANPRSPKLVSVMLSCRVETRMAAEGDGG